MGETNENAKINLVEIDSNGNETPIDTSLHFEKDVEYKFRELEHKDALFYMKDKHIHVYNANCSCPGNNIKINEKGYLHTVSIDNDSGEYVYGLLVDGDNEREALITTRSNFIKFKIID